jgi:hypothetical protein
MGVSEGRVCVHHKYFVVRGGGGVGFNANLIFCLCAVCV